MIESDYSYTQNRELSWLRFNERVLEEAEDRTVPFLERLKFAAIFSSNLDEFFMIRVGSLFDMSLVNPNQIDNKSGMTPKEQLHKIYEYVEKLNEKRDDVIYDIEKQLRLNGIYSFHYHELSEEDREFIKKYFSDIISPILSPQIVDSHHPFPHLQNKIIHIAALLKDKSDLILGLLPVPADLPDIIYLPGNELKYITIEKVLLEYIDEVFSMYDIVEKVYFCVTRNADISPDDEAYDNMNMDFRYKMKKLLVKRKRLAVVRLEVSNHLSHNFRQFLYQKFNIRQSQMYKTKTPMKMSYVFSLADKLSPMHKRLLTYPYFAPYYPDCFSSSESIIRQINKNDKLLFFPFESQKPFLQLIKEAAYDPQVKSIKITIYRLSRKANLVNYLCAAAENGKEVTVLIELRARFDEQNNINWSEKLEEAGCNIIYGFEGYKVHSKVCQITRKEKGKIKYITQIGTGNYNEKTAECYTDFSLITDDPNIGTDVAEFFRNMSIGNLDGQYKHLLVAPTGLKSKLFELIDEQILKGVNGKIVIKVNSITDIDMIKKLSQASCAGVNVLLIVRGICCILPKVPAKTENISVVSIVGQFLEHARIYSFGKEDEQKIFISSADMMTRNLERRVEVACPVYDPRIIRKLNDIIETIQFDNVKARVMDSNGIYHKKNKDKHPINSQEIFIREAFNHSNQITPEKVNSLKKLIASMKGFLKYG